MSSGLPLVREMFPEILVSLPLFPFKHFTIIKRDIFGHVCVCCRQILVAVRMTVNQTRQILGFVWVRNKFCVSLKSSRILPDAPTTELLVRGFWIFCFAFPLFLSPVVPGSGCTQSWLSPALRVRAPPGSWEPWMLQTMPGDRGWAWQQHCNAYLVLPDQALHEPVRGICDYGGVTDVSFPVCALKMPDSPRLSSAIFPQHFPLQLGLFPI